MCQQLIYHPSAYLPNQQTKSIRVNDLETFIKKAKLIHGNRYDYSQSVYIGYDHHLIIFCDKGHKFTQSPGVHFNSKNCCTICADEIKRCKLANNRLTLEEFIARSKQLYDDQYNYSDTKYIGFFDPIIIVCRKHNYVITTTPSKHLSKYKSGGLCPFCLDNFASIAVAAKKSINGQQLANSYFIEKARKIHNYKYNYDKVIFKNMTSKIEIYCSKHNSYIKVTPKIHLSGNLLSCCYLETKRISSVEEFLNKYKNRIGEKFNNYDYNNAIYLNNITKIDIICRICNLQLHQTINTHIKYGCIQCSKHERLLIKQTEFIRRAKEKHGDLYDYSIAQLTENQFRTKVKIICHHHGIFEQIANSHMIGAGCPQCGNFISKAEEKWLDLINLPKILKVTRQVKFKLPLNSYNYTLVDGYDIWNNTIYMFHGDYWHGNPNKFKCNKINKCQGKTFGELYQKTLDTENYFRDQGFRVISLWESDWLAWKKIYKCQIEQNDITDCILLDLVSRYKT